VAAHHVGLKALVDPELRSTAVAACAVAGMMPDPFRQVPDGLARLMQLEAKWPAFQLMELARKVNEEFKALTPASSAASHFSLLKRCEKQLQAGAC